MIELIVRFVTYLVADVIGGLLGGLLFEWIARLNGRRLAKASTTSCGIRVVSGRQLGFEKGWRHGAAVFRPGVIEFKGDAIPVTGMDEGVRQPTADELWWTSFDHRVVRVTSDTGVLELAVRTAVLAMVRQRLMADRAA